LWLVALCWSCWTDQFLAMGDDEDKVKGTKEIALLAEKGLALFAAEKKEDEVELDVPAATKFKEETEAKVKALEAEAALLTGKANEKPRKEKGKEAAALKTTPEYIDACKVVKGQQPKNGHFAKHKESEKPKEEEATKAAEKDADEEKDAKKKEDKKPLKKAESAGISKAERDEMEKLKNDIISKKKEMKESGMSGGQMNKDEQIVEWVKRMNELKEKENPGCLTAQKEDKKSKGKKMSADQEKDKKELENSIEEYKGKLKGEFGYTNKEMKADPDLNEMLARLAAFK